MAGSWRIDSRGSLEGHQVPLRGEAAKERDCGFAARENSVSLAAWRRKTFRRSAPASALLASLPPRSRRIVHALELDAVGVEEIDGVIAAGIILGGGIDDGRADLLQESLQVEDVLALGELEGVVVEADVAAAVLVLLALAVGLADPEQRLAVAPAGGVGQIVFELEAQEAQNVAVELLRPREVADADRDVIDADDADHVGVLPGGASVPA